MPRDTTPGKPTTHAREADDASLQPGGEGRSGRMVKALRTELGSEHGTIQRVAEQLGDGTAPVRSGCARRMSTRATRPG